MTEVERAFAMRREQAERRAARFIASTEVPAVDPGPGDAIESPPAARFESPAESSARAEAADDFLPGLTELPDSLADALEDVFEGLYPGEEAARAEEDLRRVFAEDAAFRAPPKRDRERVADDGAEDGPTIRVRIGHLQILEPEPIPEPSRPRRRAPSRLAEFLDPRRIRR